MNRAHPRATRGQAIVLMAMTAALLAFTLFTTFSIGKAVKERIQIQQAADASAYSQAVMEARAFNFYAYTNRAIVSHYVAMMAAYGHLSYLVYYEGVLRGLAKDWGCTGCTNGCGTTFSIPDQLAIWWVGWCVICFLPFGVGSWACPPCTYDSQCVPQEWDNINNACDTLTSDLNNLDTQLGYPSGNGKCAKALADDAKTHRDVLSVAGYSIGSSINVAGVSLGTGMSDILVAEQISMDNQVLKGMGSSVALPPGSNQGMSGDIAKQFDPTYKTPTLVGDLSYAGVPADTHNAGYCRTGVTSAGAVTSPLCVSGLTSLSTQQQAANASRYGPATFDSSYDLVRNRPDGMLSPINGVIALDYFKPTNKELAVVTEGYGMSRETTDPASSSAVQAVQGTPQNGCSGNNGAGCAGGPGGGSHSIAAEDHAAGMGVFSFDFACIIQGWGTMGIGFESPAVWVYSEPKGSGRIHFADGTDVDDNNLKLGGCVGSVCGVGTATINFNPTTDVAGLFGQPHTWAAVTKSFNEADLNTSPGTYGAADQGPFAMKRSLSFGSQSYTYNNGITQSGATGRDALYAIAQGLTYYHRPGDWQEPPNFYNPFWRAKLHPIKMENGGDKVAAEADFIAAAVAAGYDMASATELSLLPITE